MKNKKKLNNYTRYVSNILIISGLLYILFIFYPIIRSEVQYFFHQKDIASYSIVVENQINENTPSATLQTPIAITPVSTDFGLIINKIGLNAFVQTDIDVTSKEGYWNALENGVAHAKGTRYPGQKGNTYLFAHSTVNPLDISRYNAVFTLLPKLEINDAITTFYQGSRYDYFVDSIEIVDPTNIEPLTNTYEEPVLTLQTCYPPGTNLKRLIVMAKMKPNDRN